MKYSETLRLESDERINPELLIEVGNVLEQQGINSYVGDLDSYIFAECRKLLVQHGASHVLSVERVMEAVLPKVGPTHVPLLVKALSDQLKTLMPSQEILIVDRYFFAVGASERQDYVNSIREIFIPVVNDVTAITFITGHKSNLVTYESVKQILLKLNPTIAISCQETDDFHDRYWIVDRARGMFVGTSLNGIGKKYALTDYLKEADVADIVKELKHLKLVSAAELE